MAGVVENGIPQSKSSRKQQSEIKLTDDEEMNDSPVEQVRLTVPISDDPTQPALTFRTWLLGLISCVFLSFVNQFFNYRTNPLDISGVAVQIVVLPIGKLMAATLPSKLIQVPFTKWSFTLNPGPFTKKEHVLIYIFASAGNGGVYALHILASVKVFYHRSVHPLAAYLLALTTQMLGYGWAGVFRRYLVDSAYMWWPDNLVTVTLFSALNEDEKRPKGGNTRLQFFFLVFVSSFAYYIIPGYLFPSIASLSFVCWIWKKSITAQQIGSGNHGLGLGSFGLDWNTIAGFLGSPLVVPGNVTINVLVGFALLVYIVMPIVYWSNAYDANKFPLFSSHTFDSTGAKYNVTRILNEKTFDINLESYNNYSKLYLSPWFAFTYGLSFATLTATLSHVAVFHGKEIFYMWRKTTSSLKDQFGDVHTRIMKKNYKQVPQWWFYTILVLMTALGLVACEGFGKQLQLPWWGFLLSLAIALVFTLPIGIIQATTNQQPGLNVITELIIGYLYPGKPLANVAFKTYGYVSMSQALWLVQDFKLGHYMKVPPRSMFIVQLVGTVVASTTYFGTAWWLLTSIEHICDSSLLPEGSPWTCPGDDVFYNASIIWGIIGPLRMFGNQGVYPGMNWFFLIGIIAPIIVWLLARKFPNQKWIQQINMPTIFSATATMPPSKPVNFISWGLVGIFFNFYVYRKFKGWWARYNYVLSGALKAGVAFTALILFFALQRYDINGPSWWGLDNDDHCPLAKCPTAPGINVRGCPVL